MDLSAIDTTDDLLPYLKERETNKYEFKTLADISDNTKLNGILGKQISAFANSGGGYLILGIVDEKRSSDGTIQFQACPKLEGTTSYKDYLSLKINSCVEYPLSDYQIRAIRISHSDDVIYVVKIGDSLSAPHQSKNDRKYYQRLDGQSKDAPHFYLELLRNRFTKAVLEIDDVNYGVTFTDHPTKGGSRAWYLHVSIRVTVKNVSMASAESWGVLFTVERDSHIWSSTQGETSRPICVRHEESQLLPFEHQSITLTLSYFYQGQNAEYQYFQLFQRLKVGIRPASHNFVGETQLFECPTEPEAKEAHLKHFMARINALNL